MNLDPTHIQRLLEHGPQDDAELAEIAQLLNTAETRASRCDHWLKEHARRTNEGYSVGDLHVFMTAPVYRQTPDPELVAEWLNDLADHERLPVLRSLIEGKPVGHYMTWLRKWDWHPELLKYLQEFELAEAAACEGTDRQPREAFITAKGNAELAIRSKAPDPNYCELLPPRETQTNSAGVDDNG